MSLFVVFKSGFMPKKDKIDLNKLVKLVDKGLNLKEIGQYFGVSGEAVRQRLESLGLDTKAYKEYNAWVQFLPQIIAQKQRLLLSALTPQKVKQMRGKDLVIAFGILDDKRREIEGKGAQSVVNLIQVVQKVEEKINRSKEDIEIDVEPADN